MPRRLSRRPWPGSGIYAARVPRNFSVVRTEVKVWSYTQDTPQGTTTAGDDTLSYRWLDQDGTGAIWRTDWSSFPASVHDTTGITVNGWNLNDGYQIYIQSGDLIVERRITPLTGTIPKPSSVHIAVDGGGFLIHTV